jgi:hypothetical protein
MTAPSDLDNRSSAIYPLQDVRDGRADASG